MLLLVLLLLLLRQGRRVLSLTIAVLAIISFSVQTFSEPRIRTIVPVAVLPIPCPRTPFAKGGARALLWVGGSGISGLWF